MAYQTRGRDPLLDSSMQAVLEKRGKELLGLALIGVGILAALMIGTYSPDDPNWLVATDAPVQNWLGRTGASLAHPLFMIVGWASWVIPLVFLTWGVRLLAHLGEDRALSRAILTPIAIAIAAIYCATLMPGADWPHNFGVGGLFGDTVLSVILTVLPFSTGFLGVLLSLILGLTAFAALAFVLGFTNTELRIGWQYVLFGLVRGYEMILILLGRSAAVSLKTAQGMQARVQTGLETRRETRAERAALAQAGAQAIRLMPEPSMTGLATAPQKPQFQRTATVVRPGSATTAAPRPAAPMPSAAQPGTTHRMPPPPHFAQQQAPRTAPAPLTATRDTGPASLAGPARVAEPLAQATGGFLSTLLKRSVATPEPIPEIVHLDPPPFDADGLPDDDRIKSRIADAIRARSSGGQPEPRHEAPARPRRPLPLLIDSVKLQAPALSATRMEPPLTAATVRPAFRAEPPVSAPALMLDLVEIDEDEENVFKDADAWRDEIPAPPLSIPPEQIRAVIPVAAPEVRKTVVQHAVKKPVQPSSRAKAEAQPSLPLEDRYANYEFPPLSLLTNPAEVQRHHLSDDALEENARMLESVLDDYGVKGEIVAVRPGPVVTMYELEPAPGLKASRVIGLADDIARSMSALSARVSTVPGRSVIGIELPNANREKVVLREILSARDFGDSNMRLPLALGKDIAGEPIVANLAKMPHLLIAGTTGSGKSVAINTMILSLLYKLTPQECRLIMIDPKMLELSVYDGIPHLLSPVVTDPKKAVVALKWVVSEMEERYRKMSKMGVRNIEGYNGRVREALTQGEMFSRTIQTGFDDETGDPIFETDEFQPEVLPYIVVIVDEMADLMMVAGKEIEACIQRLAQMARASGIHLIMATQRPSVDVITGTIKANFPTRISFQVTSKIDSRTILGEMGAEQLLGMGDMLYMAGGGRITRIHGPFCSDEEVEEIVNYLKGFGPPEYMSGVVDGPDEESSSAVDAVLGLGLGTETEDAFYDMAVQIVAKDRKCSTSYIQRKLGIGYNKAARLVEQMEDEGVVTPANHVGKREVLVPEPH
jgi:DNA segregation ATPase FtsK/SpoIIIE, S-DNA-T family